MMTTTMTTKTIFTRIMAALLALLSAVFLLAGCMSIYGIILSLMDELYAITALSILSSVIYLGCCFLSAWASHQLNSLASSAKKTNENNHLSS